MIQMMTTLLLNECVSTWFHTITLHICCVLKKNILVSRGIKSNMNTIIKTSTRLIIITQGFQIILEYILNWRRRTMWWGFWLTDVKKHRIKRIGWGKSITSFTSWHLLDQNIVVEKYGLVCPSTFFLQVLHLCRSRA